MSDRQRFVNPMSRLLFCTTCCLAQPCLSRRGGRERQEGKRWSVARGLSPCFIRFPFFLSGFFSPVCDSRCPLTISKGPGSELDESWFSHKGKFGQSADFASTALCLDFFFFSFAVFVDLGRQAEGWVNTPHMTFPFLCQKYAACWYSWYTQTEPFLFNVYSQCHN